MGNKSRHALRLTLVLLCSGMAACTEFWSGPAPVYVNGGTGATTNRSAANATTPDNLFVTVRPGQSLGGIAEANHISKQAIIAANQLSPPYKLKIGQHLAITFAAVDPKAMRHKTAAASPARFRQSTSIADTRWPGRAKRAALEEKIPLDDPPSPSTAATPVPSGPTPLPSAPASPSCSIGSGGTVCGSSLSRTPPALPAS